MKTSKWPLLGLVFLLLVFAASAILFLPIPFTRDQGIYSYVSWCWLGKWWPYQYAFEHKGPWLYLTYMIFLKLSKGAMWGPNLADLLARVSTFTMLFVLCRKMLDAKKALLAALFAATPLLAVFSSVWWNDQAETFMMPLAVTAVFTAFYSANTNGRPRADLASLAAGIALSQMMMFKPTGAWLALAILVFLLRFSQGRRNIVVLYLSGIFAGIFAWFIYFEWRGIGREFFEEVILFNWFHLQGARPPLSKLLANFGRESATIFGVGILLLAAGIWRVFRNRREPWAFLALLWFLAGLAEIITQARFFLYHFLVLIPPGALVMAIGASGGKVGAGRAWKAVAAVIACFWILASLEFFYFEQKNYETVKYLRGQISKETYFAIFQEPREGRRRDFNAYADLVVANWIRERTAPGDYVLVFGYEPLVNYLAARRAPSRFHFDYPLDFEPKSRLAYDTRLRWRSIFMADLQSHSPKLVVLVHNDINALEPVDSFEQARQFPEFWSWLTTNYRHGEQIEDFEFWWRRQ